MNLTSVENRSEKREKTANQEFDNISISVASPESIVQWSNGEVKNPETINYRTQKPEKGGLFCERIFGPVKDWECSCGKHKGIRYKGVVCDRCGVEVTVKRVRRERLGHIELAVPIVHILFFRSVPSNISLMLDFPLKHLERVVYYEDYIVIDGGDTPLKIGQLLSDSEYDEAQEAYGSSAFIAMMGAEAIDRLLQQIDLEELKDELEEAFEKTKSKQTQLKLIKRLKIVRGFLRSGSSPTWMVLKSLPVIPPDLRPLVALEGGRFATSDINDLYRRVINRNLRLKNLLDLKTPDVIIRNEKRMLQEAIDALFDNGKHGRPVSGSQNRPLASLSDALKGKKGRFRQNLLGKRVDFSGRSVIVIGPELKLHQCGLPKKMALGLFEPFIIRRLRERGCHTVRAAKSLIEQGVPEVWDILEKETKHHPVLLNRAPTLHRLSIQAFEPVLIEGEAIRVHPLVCAAYNADFDGDQMAVHVPLSVEAQIEAYELMLATNNIFSPANGRPITIPSQDVILGCYYLTYQYPTIKKSDERLSIFEDTAEVEYAIAARKFSYHDRVLLKNPDYDKDTIYGNKEDKFIETTCGRVRFNEIWPSELGFINKVIEKRLIAEVIFECCKAVGREETVLILDDLKSLGFREATRSGCSMALEDMIIPDTKGKEVKAARQEVEKVEKQYRNGVITNGERYQKVIDIWTHVTNQISTNLYRCLEYNEGQNQLNPVFMMVESGARGNKAQVKQLSGMRGLMAKPSGEIIERPITANFREGLSVLEYFISTHGARKGLADTALKTADSGYMTRKLVDVAQDVLVREDDCNSKDGIYLYPVYAGDEEIVSLADRVYGRVSCEKIKDPVTNNIILKVGSLILEEQARQLKRLGIEKLKVRSILTCKSLEGCCAKCYGMNLASGKMTKIGDAVGIIAAQSIGEPGTQLTMRTFHVGGVATAQVKQPLIKIKNSGTVFYNDLRTVRDVNDNNVVLNKNGKISIRDAKGFELESHKITIGAVISVKDQESVKKGTQIATWDPYNIPVVAEKEGKVQFHDIILGITAQSETDKETGKKVTVITDHKEDLLPQVVLVDKSGEHLISHSIPVGAHLVVREGSKVKSGELLAKTPRKASRTKDITGGLPRISELFEARRPKDACVISKLSGEVSFGDMFRGKRKIIVTNLEMEKSEDHLVPRGKHIIVSEGDRVSVGDHLTEGSVAPEDLLEACGVHEFYEHMVNEVQDVYRAQGVEINDKHIEIIIRQMSSKIKITDSGDTDLLLGDLIDKGRFSRVNQEIVEMGGNPAKGNSSFQGITRASLSTESFISAASFQDTTRILTDAATSGKKDKLRNFKENVIVGRLIPAGTGARKYSQISLNTEGAISENVEGEDFLEEQDKE